VIAMRGATIQSRAGASRRRSMLVSIMLGLSTVACSKDDGHSTIHKAADDVETEVDHAPQTLRKGADDVDESARDLVGEGDHKEAPAAEQPQK
jgi:hypothetical protein